MGEPARDRRDLGTALATPATGYSVVYHLEIGLLFVTLVALGPLVGRAMRGPDTTSTTADRQGMGLADFPT
ncbi:PucC family protein [Roseivivax marinus]|nr:PucC family protein [Roseivivax marinus]